MREEIVQRLVATGIIDDSTLTEREAIQAESDEPVISIVKRRPVSAMMTNQPEPVIDGQLATRRTTTAISSAGGTGKTCLVLQAAVECALGLPVWGCPDLMPRGKPRALYVNAEDQLSSIDYWLFRILAKYELNECPFDLFPVCERERGEFLFTPGNAALLADCINAEQYDLVIVDTAISVMPAGIKFIDPLAIRTFLRSSFGVLQRRTHAAFLLFAHDNRSGGAMSGPADWMNFARLVLHLETASTTGAETILTLTKGKANLRWPFQKITLTRDPRTLTSRVIEITRMGSASAKPQTAADVESLLARIVRTEIMSLASEDRTTQKVEVMLYKRSRESGVTRQAVRDFLQTNVTVEERKIGIRATGKVVVGVKDSTEGAS